MAKSKKRPKKAESMRLLPKVKGAAAQAGATLANADRLVDDLRALLTDVREGRLQMTVEVPQGIKIILQPRIVPPPVAKS